MNEVQKSEREKERLLVHSRGFFTRCTYYFIAILRKTRRRERARCVARSVRGLQCTWGIVVNLMCGEPTLMSKNVDILIITPCQYCEVYIGLSMLSKLYQTFEARLFSFSMNFIVDNTYNSTSLT